MCQDSAREGTVSLAGTTAHLPCLPSSTCQLSCPSRLQLPRCQGMGEERLVLVGVMTFNTHAAVRTKFKALCCACWDAKYAVKMAPPASRSGAS